MESSWHPALRPDSEPASPMQNVTKDISQGGTTVASGHTPSQLREQARPEQSSSIDRQLDPSMDNQGEEQDDPFGGEVETTISQNVNGSFGQARERDGGILAAREASEVLDSTGPAANSPVVSKQGSLMAPNGSEVYDPDFSSDPLQATSNEKSDGIALDEAMMGSRTESSSLAPALEQQWLGEGKDGDLFPDVAPLPPISTAKDMNIARSQVEAIIDEVSETRAASDMSLPFSGRTMEDAPQLVPFDSPSGEVNEGGISSAADASNFQDIASQSDFERFEEGVPLMPQANSKSPEPISDDAFAFDDDNDHDFDEVSFFNEAPNPGDTDGHPSSTLHRKSTSQVLQSLHFVPNGNSSPSPFLKNNVALTEGFSAELSNSQARGSVHNGTTTNTDKIEAGGAESDLSDLWKAALADDAFLEDEDSHMTSAGYFTNDDEEFFQQNSSDVHDIPSAQSHSGPRQSSIPKSSQTVQHGSPEKRHATKSGAYVPNYESARADSSSLSDSTGVYQNLNHDYPMPAKVQQQTINVQQAMPGIPGSSRPQLVQSAQSFVDRSKAGYVSPYDLPEDVTRPRKRATAQIPTAANVNVLANGRPTPPRRDSMLSSQRSLPLDQTNDRGSASTFAEPGKSAPPLKPSSSSFFEDLPSLRTRPSSSASKSPAFPPQPKPPIPRSQTNPPAPGNRSTAPGNATSTENGYQLTPGQKLDLFEEVPSQPPSRPLAQANGARYSPAPTNSVNATIPPAAQRYAASPAVAPRPPSSHAAYQPRTSSPLTQRSLNSTNEAAYPSYHSTSSNLFEGSKYREGVSHTQAMPPVTASPPPLRPVPAGSSGRLDSTSHALPTPGYEPSQSDFQIASSSAGKAMPPRSQTQSPSHLKPASHTSDSVPSYQGSALVQDNAAQKAPHLEHSSTGDRQMKRRNLPQVEYIRPEDGRQMDELERWKGCPIFSFGFGGRVAKMFPQHVPRYASGQRQPLIKCSPGEVKLTNDSDTPLHDSIRSFPGPLKSKSKKREVIDWLKSKINTMESSASAVGLEERILLWRVVQVFVEHDGVIEGTAAVDAAIRSVLSPEANSSLNNKPLSKSTDQRSGIIKRDSSLPFRESVDSNDLELLRTHLLRGEREKAVWQAVDSRLWAHAMLISSTMNEELRKQVTQEFVRQEVKSSGGNTEALSALYQVFAGNRVESIDELVPPSARAGLQMVSKTTGSGPIRNALDGLDKWRETLTLILSNRSPDDYEAIVALGRLLASYSRTEAAHVCYLCAKTSSLFGGPEDPQVSVSLLGADHTSRPFDYARDFDSILLTEVYEFANTVLCTSSISTISPHLQAYRLYHAMVLAEHGFKNESQQYCDAVAAIMKSTTKTSPYYHALLVGNLQTLQVRLKQNPQESSGSWISKPNIDKVSGSIWAKFNSYVAGDEDGAAATPSGALSDPSAGPFAGVSGDDSTLSRTASSSDLNSFGLSTVPRPSYAPNVTPGGLYTPRPNLEATRVSNTEMLKPSITPQSYSSRPSSSASLTTHSYVSNTSPYAPRSEYPSSGSLFHPEGGLPSFSEIGNEQSTYQPRATPPSFSSQDATQHPQPRTSDSLKAMNAEIPVPAFPTASDTSSTKADQGNWTDEPDQQGGFVETSNPAHGQDIPETQPSNTYEPPSFVYQSPSQVYDPTYGEESTEERPKKPIMDLDDEDDFEARAAELRKQERARKDRETEEAFKKAAEADAQKDKNPRLNSKKSWFGGGWFSSSKEKPNEPGTQNGPIKVKLGEESSFYFDKELGKWVNKKGGSQDSAPPKPLPPPKGPPSRAVSAAGGPPPRQDATPPVPPMPAALGLGSNGVPQRAVSGPSLPRTPSSLQPSRTASPALSGAAAAEHNTTSSGPPSAPPSRPATAQSGANDLDDLYGVGQTRKGGTVKRGKKGRGYVDVMAK